MNSLKPLALSLCAIVFALNSYSMPKVICATLPVGLEPKGIAIADFNGDGKKDLATVNRSSKTISILLGNGAGSFGAATNFPATADNFAEPIALAVGDFNGDNKVDVVVGNPNTHTISVSLGNGTGGLGAPTDSGVGETPIKFAVADFNDDSKLDLAIADAGFNQGGVYILLGNGNGTFSSPTKLIAGTRPRYIVAVDLNGDNKKDLLVANVGSNNLSVFIGNGGGGFGSPTNFTVGSSPIGLVVVDLNNDTHLDLAVVNDDSHNVSILKGNGLGSFGPATNFPADTFPLSIASGDFNDDGKLDLAVGANSTGDRISILRGDGTGQFTSPASFSAGSGPYDLVADDFNGDSKSDLAIANASSNDITTLLGALPTLSIANVSITEGDAGTTTANFGLTLSSASSSPVQVFPFASGVTATSGTDFNDALTLPFTIPAGNLAANLPVSIIGDRNFEPDETFTVSLSSSLNAFIGTTQAQGTILNDDPIPSISISDASIIEFNNGTINLDFNIDLSASSFQTISVTVITGDRTAGAGSDYVAKTSTLTFMPSQLSKTFSVVVNGDTNSELNETLVVTLSNPSNATIGREQAVGTILDDDAPALLIDQATQHAIALESVIRLRDPLSVVNDLNFSLDHRSRVVLFAVDLNLAQGDVITVEAEDAQHVLHQLPVEHVDPVQNFAGLTQIIVKLPDDLPSGDMLVSFKLRLQSSNKGIVTIKP